MERTDGGFKEIWADCEGKMELDQPKMSAFDTDNDFTLTLYNLNYGHDYVKRVNENEADTQADTQEK